jgi:hypothetical protein
MPGPYLHAYAALLALLSTIWHAAAGYVAKAVLAGSCFVALGMLAALEAAKRPALRVTVPAGQPWWAYLTRCE